MRNRRPRGRSRKQQSGFSRNHVFDSNGPTTNAQGQPSRVRGTSGQVAEKYNALARDAQMSGDHVLAESLYQHAEHYQRIYNQHENRNGRNQEASNDGNSPTPPASDVITEETEQPDLPKRSRRKRFGKRKDAEEAVPTPAPETADAA